jgi:hypothetical protein
MKSKKLSSQQIASVMVRAAVTAFKERYENDAVSIKEEHFPSVFATVLRVMLENRSVNLPSFDDQILEIADALEKIKVKREAESINLFVYPDGMTIISQWEKIFPETLGDPDIILINPYTVQQSHTNLLTEETNQVNFTLVPWLESITTQNKFYTHSDKIFTMAEPTKSLLETYTKLLE